MNWYVFFVRTGREHDVEQLVRQRLGTDKFTPFIPLQERLFKRGNIVKKERKPLFPSYAFIESEMSSQEFIKETSELVHSSRNIISLLRYSHTEIAMRESEKQLMMSLWSDDFCIESSSGIISGDRIFITDGPLRGRENIVKRVNRHKREAWIEMEFMGSARIISVALEVVKRI